MSEKTRWCDFGGSYCDFPFPVYINSCPHDNNKQCPWPECQVPKQPQISERSKALADAVTAVQAYQEKWNKENESDFERNQIFNECVFAIEALEVKP